MKERRRRCAVRASESQGTDTTNGRGTHACAGTGSRPYGGHGPARVVLVLVLAGALTLALPPARIAHAADFTVTACDESSFRSVLTNAQNAGSGNRVVFACDGTINLTFGAGRPALNITTAVTLDGTGHSVTLDAGNVTRLFAVNGGASFTLNTLTLSHGGGTPGVGATTTTGGAIVNNGTTTITNSTFSNNTATGSGFNNSDGSGGAIANTGTLTITGSTFSNNTAYGNATAQSANGLGGAISSTSGSVTVTNSTFSGNNAQGIIQSGRGGALYNTGSSIMTVTNSTLSGNIATSSTTPAYGGAIDNNGGTLNVTNSTFSGNTARNFSNGNEGRGGAIASDSGTATVTNSTLSGNTAQGSGSAIGGAIYVSGTSNTAGTLNLTNSTLSGNTVTAPTSVGGGIFRGINGTANVRNTLIVNNTGGDVAVNGINGANTKNLTGAFTFASPLQNNGGPTQTLAIPTPASPTATDAYQQGDLATCQALTYAGTATALPYDQRGAPRVVSNTCSIGAFEPGAITIIATTTTVTGSAGTTATYGTALTFTATVAGSGGTAPTGTVAFSYAPTAGGTTYAHR